MQRLLTPRLIAATASFGWREMLLATSRARERLPLWDNLVDQADALCFAGVDGLAELH
jgi:hypothetical protein